MTDFSSFGLADSITSVLRDGGYTDPTPIQSQAIPLALEGHDILGIAQTGTGKTLAFSAPILNRLAERIRLAGPKTCRMLVLAPTRELASQISKSILTYGKKVRPSVATIFGGVKILKQIRQMSAGVDVVVATPGRLLDLIDQGAMTLDGVEMLVLDEADQMMDLGFIHSLKKIVSLLPKERQTMFFSATMPKAIRQLADAYLNNPVEISVAPESSTAERVTQEAFFVSKTQKPPLLAYVLKDPEVKSAIVFTRTKHGADRVVKQLARHEIEAVAIHGNKTQSQRERALGAFRSGKVWVLIATDIAARGIDISGVTHVINYELPNIPEQYVHRIGRTGRAGAEGRAIAFVSDEERGFQKDIQRTTRTKMWMLPMPGELPTPLPESAVAKSKPEEEDRPARGARRKPSGDRRPPRRKPAEGRAKPATENGGEGKPWAPKLPDQPKAAGDKPKAAKRSEKGKPAGDKPRGQKRPEKARAEGGNDRPGKPRDRRGPPRRKPGGNGPRRPRQKEGASQAR